MLRSLDLDALHEQFESAVPFRHVVIDDFLEPHLATAVAEAFPSFEASLAAGTRFETVNEHRKIQVTDRQVFTPPLRALHDFLASPGFLQQLGHIAGLRGLMADPELAGGGVHQTASGGRLDVHVDFNYLPHLNAFRRLNLLLYMNPGWRQGWGGEVELWDADVRTCHRSVVPGFNRCLIFETHQTSFHGVRKVTCPRDRVRNSVSAYYYTHAPPPGFADDFHGTVFRARPSERLKHYVLMPGERLAQRVGRRWRQWFPRRADSKQP